MVGFGHTPDTRHPAAGLIPPVGRSGVVTATLRDLPVSGPRPPHRLDHHLLILVTAGHGGQSVDFVVHPCRPGTLVWARPGQVIRYGRQPGLDAILVAWRADLLGALDMRAAAVVDPLGPTHWQLAGEDEDAIIDEVSQLVVDCERERDGQLPSELLRHKLAVLLLRIATLPATGVTAASRNGTFVRFRREVERSYARTRRVEDYAARLGCSVRTLTRASLAATGRSAKQVIDDRAALEARRLLACTDLAVAEVGERLGFPEPTNFGRFFHREVGYSPGAFRLRARSREPQVPAPRRAPGPLP